MTKPSPYPQPLSSSGQPAEAGQHYENFPVASWLCPPHLRAPISAIYRFARTADDLADEGDASAPARLADLAQFRQELVRAQAAPVETLGANSRWPQVFGPLRSQIMAFKLPVQLLHDLLDAFTQDVVFTRDARGYVDESELLDYCRRSANPIGRLLLHLYGLTDEVALKQSDAICTALQLINFWQDLSRDLPRGRYYVPQQSMAQHTVQQADLLSQRDSANTVAMVQQLCERARALMGQGAPLVHRLPGRAGWELRLVVQGGLRILDKMAALDYRCLARRPQLNTWDWVCLLWRALWMRPHWENT